MYGTRTSPATERHCSSRLPARAFAHALRFSAEGDGILCIARLNEDICEFVREHTRNHGRVLVLETAGTAADGAQAWQLLHAGASDLLTWSSAPGVAERIKARFARWQAVDALMQSAAVMDRLVGVTAAWRATLRQVIEIARFTSAFVLLTGESGTGKELLARLVHQLDSNAAESELVVVDCTAIVPELSGSEFFGHERGAFTGAVAMRDGAFAAADGGVLFLDEVGELPMPLQAQLLRVIQEGTYKRVGGNVWRHAAFRLVSATNKNLIDAIADGCFRNDLYYRIASWVVRVPSLQERREDILPLARHFLRVFRPDIPTSTSSPRCAVCCSRGYIRATFGICDILWRASRAAMSDRARSPSAMCPSTNIPRSAPEMASGSTRISSRRSAMRSTLEPD